VACQRLLGVNPGRDNMGSERLIRSLLLCTTTFERHVAAALASPADAVVLDLETTIAEGEKSIARQAAVATLSGQHRPDIFVRINQIDSPHILDDLLALQTPNLRGVMLPQAEECGQIIALDWMLSRLEQRYSRNRPVEILPLIETAKGVENLMSVLSASKRIARATFGVADYSLDAGLKPARNEAELSYIRDRLVHCSRACGLSAPIDTVWLDLNDAEGMQDSLDRARRRGFAGKLLIHPKQVDACNRSFTPSADEVAEARKIITAFEEAMKNNVAAIRVDGKLVDLPIVRSAERIVEMADRFAGKRLP
jgi:citrate lyase subunit beta / citryl-CoA lyase